MMSEEAEVTVSIVGFVEEHQPNIIDFMLRDAFDQEWRFHDKVPMVSIEDINEHSSYPVRCTVLKRFVDESGRAMAVIDTMVPDSIATLGEEHVFTVADDQILSKIA